MRIQGAASPPQSPRVSTRGDPLLWWTDISTPSAASPLRAASGGRPNASASFDVTAATSNPVLARNGSGAIVGNIPARTRKPGEARRFRTAAATVPLRRSGRDATGGPTRLPCSEGRSPSIVSRHDRRCPPRSSPTARATASREADVRQDLHIRRRRPRLSSEPQGGCHVAARPHPRHEGTNARRRAIRGTRTCIWRTHRSGPSPRGSSDTCSRRWPARRSFWAGGLPRRLHRCADPPAARAGGWR
jgi:hypothetical protein